MRNLPTIARAVASTLRGFGRDRPLFTHIVPTRACNLRCAYCHQHSASDHAMSPGTFTRVIRNLHHLGLTTVAFTGGEPLLWPHLTHALRFCSRLRLFTQVTTNGVLLSPAVVRSLADAGLDYLMLSLDAVHHQPYTCKTVADNPGVLEMLRLAQTSGVVVSINAVLTRTNIDEVCAVAELARQARWPLSIGLATGPPGEPAGKVSDLVFMAGRDVELARQCAERLVDLKRRGYPVIEPLEYFAGIPRFLAGEQVWDCSPGRRHSVVVAPDGSMCQCARTGRPTGIDAATLGVEDYASHVARSVKMLRQCNSCCYSNCAFTGAFMRAHPLRSLRNHARLFGWPALRRTILGRKHCTVPEL